MRALATLLNVSEDDIDGWTKGRHPELTNLQRLAAVVERPFSAFFPSESTGFVRSCCEVQELDRHESAGAKS